MKRRGFLGLLSALPAAIGVGSQFNMDRQWRDKPHVHFDAPQQEEERALETTDAHGYDATCNPYEITLAQMGYPPTDA